MKKKTSSSPKKVNRSISFDPVALAWVQAEAKKRDRSVNYIVNELVSAALPK